jgi:hypothetical protein
MWTCGRVAVWVQAQKWNKVTRSHSKLDTTTTVRVSTTRSAFHWSDYFLLVDQICCDMFEPSKETSRMVTERYLKAVLDHISAQSFYDFAVASAVKASHEMKSKERKFSTIEASLESAASSPPETSWFGDWFGESATEVDRRKLEKELKLANEELASARFYSTLIRDMESKALERLHEAEIEHKEASKADPILAASVTIDGLMSLNSQSVSSGAKTSEGGGGLRQRGAKHVYR